MDNKSYQPSSSGQYYSTSNYPQQQQQQPAASTHPNRRPHVFGWGRRSEFLLPAFDDHVLMQANLELQRLYYELEIRISEHLARDPNQVTTEETHRYNFHNTRRGEVANALINLQHVLQY
jgi:hypothetical protein